MSIPSRLRIAAIVVAVLATAPAFAHVEQALQSPADSELG
jgi:hypothetical protein